MHAPRPPARELTGLDFARRQIRTTGDAAAPLAEALNEVDVVPAQAIPLEGNA